ncbi:hypothetical protein E2562_008337 [Oryza meyeriana var. granulata]|uniref:DUF3615 domain-containing protein n=1 Tax=Oryza meyeriana var. granulata TaxID=110450 RepID=A0A6G1EGX9_9ORYZ|nr:hypothetical protein E2562_008337 [Oryza meyeriana var. granulata]
MAGGWGGVAVWCAARRTDSLGHAQEEEEAAANLRGGADWEVATVECVGEKSRERDAFIITHVRYALHHSNAKHPVHFIRVGIQLVLINFIAISSCPELHGMTYIIDLCLQGEEFDAVKPLMDASVRFRGQVWFHVNFWARCRKTKKIKCFFAEVH